ncbi:hypothetical protein MRX96_032870 [Rhipicephalus microplus]
MCDLFAEIATDNEVAVLESLRNLLSNSLNRNRGPVAPATVIVIFKFGHLRSSHQRLKPLLPRVLGSNKGAGSIIAVGNNLTSLQQLVRREGRGVKKGHDKVILLAATEDAAKDVANKIVDEACTAPALLRCSNDGVESKEKCSFQGSVTENGVIYLMLDPEDYNNFEDLNIKIEAVGGTLKVCQRRSKFHHLQLQDCDTVSENELMFRPSCKGDPCNPLYLAIVGISEECSSVVRRSKGPLLRFRSIAVVRERQPIRDSSSAAAPPTSFVCRTRVYRSPGTLPPLLKLHLHRAALELLSSDAVDGTETKTERETTRPASKQQ